MQQLVLIELINCSLDCKIGSFLVGNGMNSRSKYSRKVEKLFAVDTGTISLRNDRNEAEHR